MTTDNPATTRQFCTLFKAGDAQAIAAQSWPAAESLLAQMLPAPQSAMARCGVLGFSFPVWRFLSQTANGSSLLERFGMTRLRRANDHRDASLPDPARDEFGVGFATTAGAHYIEYRRAYILCAHPAHGCLIIRNNSWYFGRDRLPWPAALSSRQQKAQAWQQLGRDDLRDFSPLDRDDANAHGLLSTFEAYDAALHAWLLAEGAEALAAFLNAKLAAGRGVPYAGWIKAGLPPWTPVDVTMPDAAFLEQLRARPADLRRSGYRLTLLSGPKGDLPVV